MAIAIKNMAARRASIERYLSHEMTLLLRVPEEISMCADHSSALLSCWLREVRSVVALMGD
jgi:hypothetical protein